MDNEKTFEGWELAKAIKEGKFKEDTKFQNETGIVSTVKEYEGELGLWGSYDEKGNQCWDTNLALINRTFTLITEPKLYYFNQVRKTNKKIRIKGWNKFVNLQGALDTLSTYNDKVINEAFTKKVWEVEE